MEWIDAKNSKPKTMIPVLVKLKGGYAIAFWNEKCWRRLAWNNMPKSIMLMYSDMFDIKKSIVTHWMPLPEVPKDEE